MNEAIRPVGSSPLSTALDTRRANAKLAEALGTGMRVLTDYAPKLDRIIDAALNTNRQRNDGEIYRVALDRLGSEFLAILEPLRWWIVALSALHEEGRLTEPQRMELRLRLSELESKFQTANLLLEKLNVLGPT